MTIFETVKANVTPRMAAERYGLRVSRSGMVRCLFHDDATPSMKLYDDHYHCFGCQATGDVIRLVVKLFGVPVQEAAKKLAEDFGVQREKTSVLAKLSRFQEQAEQERLCLRVLRDYLHLLEEWRTKFAPKTPEEAAAVTPGEAMTAMQAAIWTFGNREFSFSVDGSVVTGPALQTYYFSSMDFTWQEGYIASGNTIKKMYDYLVQGTLEPTPSTTIITKLDAFADVQLIIGDRISGGAGSSIFDTDLTVTLGDTVTETDDLTLTVLQGDSLISEIALLPGKTVYDLSDLQLQENAEISMHLKGEHTTDTGVYLYEAEDPWVSQSLVGCHEGTQQVALVKSAKFRVSYQCELEIKGKKELENGKLREGQFLFQLCNSGTSGSTIEEIRNDADGNFTFSPLFFTSEDLEGSESRTLHYTVREVPEGIPGINYDTAEYDVEVLLYLEGDELKAEIVSPNLGICFVNSIETVDIPVRRSGTIKTTVTGSGPQRSPSACWQTERPPERH